MRVTKKSFHGWLYQFTYTKRFPDNLCPYWWKLVWAFIVFIPNLLCQLPGIVMQKVKKQEDDCGERRENGALFWVIGSLLVGYLYSQYHWIKAMLNTYSYDAIAANVGWMFDLAIVVGVCIYYIRKYREKKQDMYWKYPERKRPNIIVEFVKATYGKYCPQLEWTEETETKNN